MQTNFGLYPEHFKYHTRIPGSCSNKNVDFVVLVAVVAIVLVGITEIRFGPQILTWPLWVLVST